MQRIQLLIGLSVVGLTAFAQEMPNPQVAPQPATATTRETKMARRQATQRLVTDFGAAVKNASLSPDDAQKAQAALTQLQAPHGKGSARDPQGRHEAMKTVREMSASAALRPADRELLAKDLAALKPVRK